MPEDTQLERMGSRSAFLDGGRAEEGEDDDGDEGERRGTREVLAEGMLELERKGRVVARYCVLYQEELLHWDSAERRRQVPSAFRRLLLSSIRRFVEHKKCLTVTIGEDTTILSHSHLQKWIGAFRLLLTDRLGDSYLRYDPQEAEEVLVEGSLRFTLGRGQESEKYFVLLRDELRRWDSRRDREHHPEGYRSLVLVGIRSFREFEAGFGLVRGDGAERDFWGAADHQAWVAAFRRTFADQLGASFVKYVPPVGAQPSQAKNILVEGYVLLENRGEQARKYCALALPGDWWQWDTEEERRASPTGFRSLALSGVERFEETSDGFTVTLSDGAQIPLSQLADGLPGARPLWLAAFETLLGRRLGDNFRKLDPLAVKRDEAEAVLIEGYLSLERDGQQARKYCALVQHEMRRWDSKEARDRQPLLYKPTCSIALIQHVAATEGGFELRFAEQTMRLLVEEGAQRWISAIETLIVQSGGARSDEDPLLQATPADTAHPCVTLASVKVDEGLSETDAGSTLLNDSFSTSKPSSARAPLWDAIPSHRRFDRTRQATPKRSYFDERALRGKLGNGLISKTPLAQADEGSQKINERDGGAMRIDVKKQIQAVVVDKVNTARREALSRVEPGSMSWTKPNQINHWNPEAPSFTARARFDSSSLIAPKVTTKAHRRHTATSIDRGQRPCARSVTPQRSISTPSVSHQATPRRPTPRVSVAA